MDNSYAVECEDLTKQFGEFTAVDSLKLRIKKGEIFGFLGPNGAGKTTTIKMLTTLISPTRGSATVAGFDLYKEPAFVRSRIGVVPQQFALFDELTPLENLEYIGDLYGMKKLAIAEQSHELLKRVDLYDKKDVIAGGFSGGMKQRLSVAAGLLQNPDILFMDEPTTGLDPQSRLALRELTKELNLQGITIVYTTHDMEEADKLCHRIAIIDRGKIIADGTSDQLKTNSKLGFFIHIGIPKVEQNLVDKLKKASGATDAKTTETSIELRVSSVQGGTINRIMRVLEHNKADVQGLRISEATLEDVFINLTNKDLRD